MAGEVSVSGGRINTPVGDAPILPVLFISIGAYTAWFAVHYWRDKQQKYPSDPLKSFLTGKGLPKPQPNTPYSEAFKSVTEELKNASAPAGGGGTIPAGFTSNSIAADALKYQGQGYVWGGNADRPGNWDCSSYVSYVLGHDLGLPLPGGHWGDPGFPPHAHGPTTTEYMLYGSPISRGQVQAGDLIVWNDHIAIAVSASQAISAHSPAIGTTVTGIDAENAYHGGNAHYRRVGGTPSAGGGTALVI